MKTGKLKKKLEKVDDIDVVVQIPGGQRYAVSFANKRNINVQHKSKEVFWIVCSK